MKLSILMNLNQVTMPSLNIAQAIRFYENLGLTLIVDSQPNYARFECPVGQATFSLHLTEELPIGKGTDVYFECEDLDDKVKKLRGIGVHFEQLPTDESWLWREARLKDPDGNSIILYYAGKNRLNPPWRIKS